MAFNIVLVQPVIPQNTGNIARLTAATNSMLHLIEPLAFSLDEKHVRRAGLDYWPEVRLQVHADWESFLGATGAGAEQLWLFSTKSARSYYQTQFHTDDYLVFDNETTGLPEQYHWRYPERRLLIPMGNPRVRSLNLSNAVSAALFEALRQVEGGRGL